MKIHLNDTSPFARLVLVCALEAGMENIELCWTDPWASPRELIEANPFSTIPVLELDATSSILDSILICQYLIRNSKNISPILFHDENELSRLSTGKTLMDISFRNVMLSRFVDGFDTCDLYIRGKAAVERSLSRLDDVFFAPPGNESLNVSMTDLCLAVAVAYVQFRLLDVFNVFATDATKEKLSLWLKRPFFELTSPQALKSQPSTLERVRHSGRQARHERA